MQSKFALIASGFIFLFLLVFYFSQPPILAQENIDTTTVEPSEAAGESFFDGLPPATLRCAFGGLFTRVFPGDHKAMSTENAILIDGEARKMAVREKLIVVDKNNTGVAEMYIEVLDVTNDDLVNLLVLKKTVATNKALIDLILKKEEEDIIVKTKDGVSAFSTLFAKVRKIGSTTFNSKEYFLVSGDMKIKLPAEKLELIVDGQTDPTPNTEPGFMHCRFKRCPVVKTNLDRLKEEFSANIGDIIGGEEDEEE